MDYLTKPGKPEGAVHLIIGYSLVWLVTIVRAHWQIVFLSFSDTAMAQSLASLKMLEVRTILTVGHEDDEHEVQMISILPLRFLYMARMMEDSI